MLAPGVIEIGGLAGTLLLLVPVVVLAVVMLRASRIPTPPPARKSAPLRAISEGAFAGPEPEEPPATAPLAERIRIAEAAGDARALAGLYLAEAREALRAGRADAAADRLRASLRAASAVKDKAVQAEARLELAEIAREAGDLTTACEHWQIARALFHEGACKKEVAETETLMRRHGCPTDWVLTDF